MTRFMQIAELAAGQHGVITTTDVAAAGIDTAALRALARTGAVIRLASGLYRVPLIETTRLTPFMEAVLWTRRNGVVSHASGLTIRGYGDFAESHIDLTLPRNVRLRKSGPTYYRLWHEDLAHDEIVIYEGIPVTTVLKSIKDAKLAGADPQQLRLAARQAFQAGELNPAQDRAARRLLQSGAKTRNAS
ncbi:MAG: type IV toxin-antitoxin system AbiEi family antitoxin domain-containing protein [Candidatus Nanopelagicales bacterium]